MITVNYDDLFTFENLYTAYKKCCKGRMYKADKIRFEQDIATNLVALQQRLLKRTYQLTSYRSFTIKTPKIRHIHRIAFEDKIVQRILCDHVLNDFTKHHLIYDSCAIVKGKGIAFALKRIKHHLRSYYGQFGCQGYVLRMDIKDYYASINQEYLIQYWHKHIEDEEVYQLLKHIITSYPKGIPMGNQCSQVFANLYLDPLDHFIKEVWHIQHYIRYMDDMYLLHSSKTHLQNVRENTKQFLSKYQLTLNQRKTKIYPLSQGCTFIGWHFHLHKDGHVLMKVSKQSKKRMIRNMKLIRYQKRFGRIQTKTFNQKISSTLSYLKQGETGGLRKKLMKEVTKERK